MNSLGQTVFPSVAFTFLHVRVSALQLRGDGYQCHQHVPSTAQEGKEKEREGEIGAATSHPSKRYENRHAEGFQIPSTTVEGQQNVGCQDSVTDCACGATCARSHGWGKTQPVPVAGMSALSSLQL